MEMRTITYQRVTDYKVEGKAAAALRAQGHSLMVIQFMLGTTASLPTISRAIARAKAEANS